MTNDVGPVERVPPFRLVGKRWCRLVRIMPGPVPMSQVKHDGRSFSENRVVGEFPNGG